MAEEARTGVSFHDLSKGGQLGALIRQKDWSRTPLGPRSAWPRSLHNYVSMILELPTAAIVFWGPEQVQLYNDGYSVIMGPRHPEHLGSTFRECWPEAYAGIHPWMQRVLQNGETVEVVRTLVPLTRFGFTEEAYFTFSFSPLRDDDGELAGILQLVTEVTDAVLGERRASALHDLSNLTAHAKTTQDAARLAVDVLGKYGADLPFCLVYAVDPDDHERMTLTGSTGLPDDYPAFPRELDRASESAIPELARVVGERRLVALEDLVTRFGSLPTGAWPEPTTMACACPIVAADQQRIVAVLVVGTSPRLAFDDRYRDFVQLVCAHTSTLIAAARAYDDERQRAEAFAQIDRAKTEWERELRHANNELETFSYSVSHDLRAPLRAIDGFSQALLEDHCDQLDDVGRRHLARVRAAAQRMGLLIDDLLRLARINAAPLVRERIDVTALARELLGDLAERGHGRAVEATVADGLVAHADRRLVAVLLENLLGNAWKFTSKTPLARIHVGREEREGETVFFVRDNGAGFAMEFATKLFAPFQRLHSQDDFEGTGIGLATVQRVVDRHRGRVWAEAAPSRGATFFFTVGEPA